MAIILSIILLFAQTTYYGPMPPSAANDSSLVRVEILVYDESKQGGLEIESVSFYGQQIALQSRNVQYFRGGGNFQVLPGIYRIKWRVSRDQFIWPRTVDLEKMVEIEKRDFFMQIVIRGDQLNVY